jgi:competence protein ComEC
MRRPLCIVCFGALGTQLAFAFLPQVVFWPLAAFCILAAAVLTLWRRRGICLCLAVGGILGLAMVGMTFRRIEGLTSRYDGQEVQLTACVEEVSESYYEGMVRAVLRVETVDGEAANFRCLSPCMPACEAGQRIEGRFSFAEPDADDKLDRYADGVVFLAEYKGRFADLGKVYTFRAVTHRLQQALSEALRAGISEEEGSVLVAMTLGDRSHLTTELKTAYRAAGLSHVLVVSGLHVTILCGGIWQLGRLVRWFPNERQEADGQKKRRRRFHERSRRSRVAQALYSIGIAVLLVGVTGFTPSVLRASGAVLISSVGVLLLAPADALTSLGVAGVCMTIGNSYAVCDIGFELSFASVLGTLAGAELARRAADAAEQRRQNRLQKDRLPPRPNRLRRAAISMRDNLRETVCISLCASAAVFPVLVLRGMSTSLYALVSGVAVVWAVQPILLCGLAAALTGFASGYLPWLAPLYTAAAFCGETLTYWLNRWVRWVAGWPKAMLHFETAYAALAALIVLGLLGLAVHWKVRARLAVPVCAVVFLAAVLAGSALDQGIVSVAMLGSTTSPVIIITQGEQAMVLFRGGSTEVYRVQTYLENRSIDHIEVLVDLRVNPSSTCALAEEAASTIVLAEQEAYRQVDWTCGGATGSALCTNTGNVALLQIGGVRLATVNGSIALAQKLEADYLLAGNADPRNAVNSAQILALGTKYSWLQEEMETQGDSLFLTSASALTLRLRPQGGEQLLTG